MTKHNIDTVNVRNGVATTEYTVPSNFKVGQSTIIATYIENDNYQTASANGQVTIKRPTSISVGNTLASKGQTGVFTATVLDTVASTNVSEGTVQFKLDGVNFGSPVTSSNGTFTLNQTIPNDAETGDEITAVYQGNNTYAGCTTTTAGILTLRQDINITVPTLSANRGSTPTITATCTDGNSDPITTGSAILKIDGVQSGQAVTIDSQTGTFEFTSYSVPASATVGSHTITVEYQQNDSYNATTGTGSLIVRTPTVLTAVDTSANPGEEGHTLQVNVRDNDNHEVTEGTVEITVGSNSAVQAAVSNGVATITYDVPAAATGTINFTASYIQNANYQSSTTATAGVITIRQAVTVSVSDVSGNLSETVNLSATVTSGGNDVDEGQLTFDIED